MKRPVFNKSCLLLLVVIIVTAMGLSCVDIPATGPDLPELKAEFCFLNAAVDVGNVGITVDETSVGSLDFAANSAYTTFDAGSRVVYLSNDDTLRVAMNTSERGLVVILPLAMDSLTQATGIRSFHKMTDRRIFDATEADTGLIRFTNAALAPDTVSLTIVGTDTTVTITETDTTYEWFEATETIIFDEDTGYLNMPVGEYAISVADVSDAETVIATTTLAVTNKRQTSVIVGENAGSVTILNLNDD